MCPNNIIYRLPGFSIINFNFINPFFFKCIQHTDTGLVYEFLGVYTAQSVKKNFINCVTPSCDWFPLTLQEVNVNHCKKIVRPHLGSCSPGFVICRDIKQTKSQTKDIIRSVFTLMFLVPGLVDFGEVIEDPSYCLNADFCSSKRPFQEQCIADIELFYHSDWGEVTCKVKMMIFKEI